MATAFSGARPTLTDASASTNSAPFRGPAVTRRRGAASADRPTHVICAHGPSGRVRSGTSSGGGLRWLFCAVASISFSVSPVRIVGRRRNEVVLRFVMAATRIVAREVEQDLPPGLLRFLGLAIPLEAGCREEQPAAFALKALLRIGDPLLEVGG